MKKNNRIRLCFAALLVLLLCAALTPAVSAAAGDSPDNPLVLGKGKTVLTAEDAARLSGPAPAEYVRVADGVTEIADEAFADCFNLRGIELPEGLQRIGNRAFTGCSRLETVTMRAGLRSIGDSAFSRCMRLRSAELPEGLQYIGSEAFATTGLTEVRIPASVTRIESRAYYGCDIRTLYFNAVCCEDKAGDGSSELFQMAGNPPVLVIGPAVTRIPADFLYASNLTEATIPASVVEIGDRAFQNCLALEELTFENPATRLGEDVCLDKVRLRGLNRWMLLFGMDDTAQLGALVAVCLLLYLAQGVLLTVVNLRLTRRRYAGRARRPDTAGAPAPAPAAGPGDRIAGAREGAPAPMLAAAAISPWLLLGVLYWMVLTVTRPPATVRSA